VVVALGEPGSPVVCWLCALALSSAALARDKCKLPEPAMDPSTTPTVRAITVRTLVLLDMRFLLHDA
jgi:hypothetical protein